MTLFDDANVPMPDALPDRKRLGTFRKTDEDTPRLAALTNYDGSGKQRREVLKALVEAGDHGMTDFEHEANGILRTSAGKRRLELEMLRLVERTTERRATDTGSSAVVFKVTDAGRRSWLLVAGSET